MHPRHEGYQQRDTDMTTAVARATTLRNCSSGTQFKQLDGGGYAGRRGLLLYNTPCSANVQWADGKVERISSGMEVEVLGQIQVPSREDVVQAAALPRGKRAVRGTSGDFIMEQLRKETAISDIIAGLKEKFSDTKAGSDEASAKRQIAFYRCKLKNEGKK